MRCIVCDKHAIPAYAIGAAIPLFYCPRCYDEWAPHQDEPWLKYLIKSEVKLRVCNHRTEKRGVEFPEVPLNYLGDGMTSSSFMGWCCAACSSPAPPVWVKNWICPCGASKRARVYERGER